MRPRSSILASLLSGRSSAPGSSVPESRPPALAIEQPPRPDARGAPSEHRPGAFESLLDQHAAQRERALLAELAEVRPDRGRGDGADYSLSIRGGFLPLREAAKAMAVSEPELLEQASRGRLEAFVDFGLIYVRPAIVSVVHVRQPSDDGDVSGDVPMSLRNDIQSGERDDDASS